MMVGFHGIGLPVPKGNPSEIQYLLRDEFITDRAAGAVNGTAAEPGPGTRTVIDTENKLSISADNLSVSGGKTSAASGDPGLWLPSQSRVAGRIMLSIINASNLGLVRFGWSNAQSGAPNQNAIALNGSNLQSFDNSVAITLGVAATSTQYYLASALRATGAFHFLKITTGNWLLLWGSSAANSATVYPAVANFNAAFIGSYIRVPDTLWLPTPLASEGFASAFGTTDGLGHAETTGIGSGGGGQAWTQQSGMWGISSGKAIASSLLSGEAVATVPLSTANPFVGIDLERTLGDVGGVARWTDANNHLRWYHDGTNHVLQQVVSGTPTTLITAAATYSANARSWLWLNGTTARLYYNNTLTGSTSSINAGLTAMNVGIRTTDTANAMDNFAAYAVGVEGQYNLLNQY